MSDYYALIVHKYHGCLDSHSAFIQISIYSITLFLAANFLKVIVGDMDGSGSRGITWLLRAGGVWMRTTNEWLDWARDEHPLSNALMQSTHSLDYKYVLPWPFSID